MQRVSIVAAGNPASGETIAPLPNNGGSTTNIKKPKRRWLRLDVAHHRNIFLTTFFRIILYRKTHIFSSLLQLILPPMMLLGMIGYIGTEYEFQDRGWTNFSVASEKEIYEKMCDRNCTATCFMEHGNTTFAKKFIPKLESQLNTSNIELKIVSSKEDITRHALRHHLQGHPQEYIGGISIYNPPVDPPRALNGIGDEFKLRFTVVMAQEMPPFPFEQPSTFVDLNRNKPESYYQLLGIELAVLKVFRGLILNETATTGKIKTINQSINSIDIQSIPYPPHQSYSARNRTIQSGVENEISEMITTIFVLSMVPCFFTVVEGAVTEKEDGFKLYLMLMGFPRGAYWFSWILNQMLVQIPVIIMQVVLLFSSIDPNGNTLVKQGNWSLWFTVLLLFNFSALSFFIFLAAFFRRGKMATFLGILIWLISFHFLEALMPSFDFGSELSSFLLSCLVPSGSLHWAVQFLTAITSNTWGASLKFPLTRKSGFHLADVMAMMIGDFFIYFLLTLYVDNLNPGPLEYSQPWNYFFEGIKCRYIDPNIIIPTKFMSSKASTNVNKTEEKTRRRSSPPNVAIDFQNTSKKFHLIDGVYGIEDVKFSAPCHNITVLLGHADSGRTTLMRLVCGEYSPTNGTVCVFGYNVRKDTQKVQSFLSVCMEKNLLCEYLTVMEHMKLIGKLKGLPAKETEKICKEVLESVGLLSIGNYKVWRLVTWERRVLCVAMALVGNAPILLLDEPTRDLELDVKRQIWSLLKDLKMKGKTILMSSDNIEEAYQVADRIVIMSRGRIAGVGTPAKLETLFETGYNLQVTVVPNFNKEDILNCIREHIPSAKESEGSLKKVSKAMHVLDWDAASQTYLQMPTRTGGNETVVHVSEHPHPEGQLLKVIQSITHKDLKRQESDPTFDPMNGSAEREPTSENVQLDFILPFREKVNFPKLFDALNDAAITVRLGIKSYDLLLQDMETAFNEVDDFVDVLNAASSETDIGTEDFVDIKALRLPMEEPRFAPLPSDHHQLKVKPRICNCCRTLWALIVKRIFYIIGNYRHAIIQILGPIIILVITIHCTDIHFKHRLISHTLAYNTSSKAQTPVVPYRFLSGPIAKELYQSFEKVLKRPPNNIMSFENLSTSNFENHYTSENRYKLHGEVTVAADFTQVDKHNKVVAMFSSGHQHSAPLSVLLMINAILDYEFPLKNYSVEMNAQAIQSKTEKILLTDQTLMNYLMQNEVHITLTVSLAFGYFIFTSGFVSQPCAERVSKLKRYQLNLMTWNGLYWIGFSLIDLLCNSLVILILVGVLYNEPHHRVFRDPQFIILFILTGMFGGFASIIMSYIYSHYLLKTATSYYATLSINQFLGLFMFLFYTIINYDYIGKYAESIAFVCFQIIQQFTIPWNFYAAILRAFSNARCTVLDSTAKEEICATSNETIRGTCCKNDETETLSLSFIWNDTKLLTSFVFLVAHSIGTVVYLMSMERRRVLGKIFRIISHSPKSPPLRDPKDLEAIKNEENFVAKAGSSEDPNEQGHYFIVKNLGTTSGLVARSLLREITFAAEPGKCTVIVGPPTSGITVLYEAIAGLRAVFEGKVSYGGYSLFSWTERKKLLYQMGFCPSNDVVVEKSSGLQLLKLFGRLRGIPANALSSHIDYWVQGLALQKVIKKKCHSYSPVIRKKLAVALAAIGNPPIIIFDEPTLHLDPVSRLQVCNVLDSLVHANRVVIVMTHDLSSIERICSKLIFLVNGQMQYCENPDVLYKDISYKFSLIVKLKGDETGRINFNTYTDFKTKIEAEIESMILQQEESHSLTYIIESRNYNWSNLFAAVEKITSEYQTIIQDYHIRKTSLEDLYKSYAAKQRVFRKTQSTWEEFRTTYC